MKTILSLVVSLSLLPLVSTARLTTLKPLEKTTIIPNSAKPSAFKTPEINLESSVCGSACLTEAGKIIGREDIQAINRTGAEKEDAEAIGSVLNMLPSTASKLKSLGLEVKSSSKAIVAAITKSVKENWDTNTQANVVAFVESLALDPVANQKKLAEVRANCRR